MQRNIPLGVIHLKIDHDAVPFGMIITKCRTRLKFQWKLVQITLVDGYITYQESICKL